MTQGLWLVVDNEFNRANQPKLVGQWFETPPSYAAVSSERNELDQMNDFELVAYWNVLQFSRRITDAAKIVRHLIIVDELLTVRGISHQQGKRIITRKAA